MMSSRVQKWNSSEDADRRRIAVFSSNTSGQYELNTKTRNDAVGWTWTTVYRELQTLAGCKLDSTCHRSTLDFPPTLSYHVEVRFQRPATDLEHAGKEIAIN